MVELTHAVNDKAYSETRPFTLKRKGEKHKKHTPPYEVDDKTEECQKPSEGTRIYQLVQSMLSLQGFFDWRKDVTTLKKVYGAMWRSTAENKHKVIYQHRELTLKPIFLNNRELEEIIWSENECAAKQLAILLSKLGVAESKVRKHQRQMLFLIQILGEDWYE